MDTRSLRLCVGVLMFVQVLGRTFCEYDVPKGKKFVLLVDTIRHTTGKGQYLHILRR